MLITADTSEKAFGINSNIIITKEGIVNRQAPIRFYPWQDDHSLMIKNTPTPISAENTLKIAQFHQLKRWWIHWDVSQSQKG